MRFVDFAIQGFLDVRGAAQVRFGPSLTPISTEAGSPLSFLSGLLEALFSEGYDPSSVRLASPGAKSTRSVITVQSSDRSVYRLVRDIVRGSAQLLSFRDGDFVPVSSDASEIVQFLRGRVGLPSRQIYESAFVLRPEQLPSQAATAKQGVASHSVGATQATPLTPQEHSALENRLGQLRRALDAHAAIDSIEFELDGLQKRCFDLESEIARREMDTTAIDEAEHRYKMFKYLEELPEDFPIRGEFYTEATQRRARDLERWERERSELERDLRTIEVDPIGKDWRLWSGLGLGGAVLAAGFVLPEPLQLLALLDIPAFGLSAFVLWHHLLSLELRDSAHRKIEISDRRKELIVTRDDVEIRSVEQALEQVGHGSSEVAEVLKRLDGLHVAKAELESARRAYHDANTDPELVRMKREFAELRETVGELEIKLASSSLGGEALRVREEIAELERQLNGKTSTYGLPERGPVVPAASEGERAAAGPLVDFLAAASELLLQRPEQACAKVGEASRPFLHNLSRGELATVRLDHHGEVLVGSGSEFRTLLALPPATQDVVYMALRAGLLASLSDRMRAPFLVCGLESTIPQGEQFVVAFASMLAHHTQTVSIAEHAVSGWPEGAAVAVF